MLMPSTYHLALEEIVHLRARVETLVEEVRQLKELVLPQELVIPIEFRLTTNEAVVLGVLYSANGGIVSRDKLMDALYQLRPGQKIPEPKIVDVFICRMRGKLKPYQLEIHTVWAQGYRLDAKAIERLKNWDQYTQQQNEAEAA